MDSIMCDEANPIVHGASETADGVVIKLPPAPSSPKPSNETEKDSPEVIPDVPNAPIL